MIRLLTSADQAELDYWWAAQSTGPMADYFMYSNHISVPVLSSSTWEMIALGHHPRRHVGHSSPDAYLFLHLSRSWPKISASAVLMSTNPMAIVPLIRNAEAIARRHSIRYIDATVAETNERSLRLCRKILGEPWGLEPESVNYQGKMVGCYRFRHKL